MLTLKLVNKSERCKRVELVHLVRTSQKNILPVVYLLEKLGVDTAEKEPFEVRPACLPALEPATHPCGIEETGMDTPATTGGGPDPKRAGSDRARSFCEV